MKTPFLSLILITVFLSLPWTSFAKTIDGNLLIEQFQTSDNSLDTDDPISYAARIKRFRQTPKGLDYFDPDYTGSMSYLPRMHPKANPQEVTPYEFINFSAWTNIQNDLAIWRYNIDENYRKIVNNWNKGHNPFWVSAIRANCPFGTFDFTAGLAKTNEVIVYDYAIGRAYGFNTTAYKIGLSNAFGRPFTGKAQQEETKTPSISIVQLPTRDLKHITVNHQTIEKPNFTKHVPMNLSWDKYEGLRNGTSAKHLSVSEKFERGNRARANKLNFAKANAGFMEQDGTTNYSNQQYNNLSTSNKTNSVYSHKTSNPQSSSAASRTPTKAAKTTTSNN
ncbi:MAG: hypothetical protein AB8G86_19905 [Saprospiraceae bacterium]